MNNVNNQDFNVTGYDNPNSQVYNSQNNYQNSNGTLNYPKPENSLPINPNAGRTQPVTGWSWGAAMYGWIWGIANGTYLPLLALIPFLNMFWWIVCGIKGHEWALNSGMWKTVEEFNAVQKSWNRAGKVAFWFTVIFVGIYIIFWILWAVIFGFSMFAALANELGSYPYY